jgi:hypothetical protein
MEKSPARYRAARSPSTALDCSVDEKSVLPKNSASTAMRGVMSYPKPAPQSMRVPRVVVSTCTRSMRKIAPAFTAAEKCP